MAGSKNWYPLQQAAFLTFAQNYCGTIAGAPTTFGCVVGDGTSLSANFSDFQTKFCAMVTGVRVSGASASWACRCRMWSLRPSRPQVHRPSC